MIIDKIEPNYVKDFFHSDQISICIDNKIYVFIVQ
jgi:hypothetical protein